VESRHVIVVGAPAGRAVQQGRPRRDAAGRVSHRSGGRGPTVLRILLTTTLDYPGHVRNEKPRKLGRCDRLDGCNPPGNA